MSKFSKSSRSSGKQFPLLTVALLLLVIVLGAALLFLLNYPNAELTAPASTAPTAEETTQPGSDFTLPAGTDDTAAPVGTETNPITAEVITEAASEPVVAETLPAPTTAVISGNNNAESVLCKGSYTGSGNPAAVVAKAGDAELTNAALQIFYAAEVGAAAGAETAPNFAWPLENQLCTLGSGTLSWQHYFLERAVKSWQNVQAMLWASRQPQPADAKGYNFLDYLHAEYVPEGLPVHDFIYCDRDSFIPNKTHQAYLDSLSNVLNDLAAQQGCTADSLVQAVFGTGVTVQNVLDAARDYNLAYMYFTEKSYNFQPTDEEVGEYLNAHIAELPGASEQTVSIRHLLLIPEGASVAPDGTVTASAESWAACEAAAQEMHETWAKEYVATRHPEGNFGQLTSEHSQDLGSKLDGGYYQNLTKGQLPSSLDSWCFDAARHAGDMTILRSEAGVHIVYFVGSHSKAELAARDALKSQMEKQLWKEFQASVPLTVDYSAVSVPAMTSDKHLSLNDLLYPDIGHERFPEAITYLQQDFYYYPWGGSTVGQGGCGITTFAMLSTYMTDSLQTPAMMADRYAFYFANGGTNADIFRFGVGDMGYYIDTITTNIDEAIAALRNGQRVISLQVKGHFTSAGHYLLLQRYNDDGTFQLRDSNVYNYLRLSGHKIDAFTRDNLLSGGTNFWVMQKKIVTIPACWRCGTEYADHGPEILINGDYTCEKCSEALSRRDSFLSLVATV